MDEQPNNVRRIRRPAHKPSSPGRRMRANWPAELRCGPVRISCYVVDISVGGAKLRIAGVLPWNVINAWLIVEPFGPIYTETVWRKHEWLGVRFFEDHPEIGHLKTRRFDAASWIETEDDPAARISPDVTPASD
ncbi:MAG: PilZ domain-containing protein [Stellaceae bacterium]